MKKYMLLGIVTLFLALPAMAAKVASIPITHEPLTVFQAYEGDSDYALASFEGYEGIAGDPIHAVPGVFSICPGDNWSNFVGANQVGQPYFIKNVVLTKQTPTIGQCADIFPAKTISQQGTVNIRTWWPLMYEVPGTTWTLTILYGTTTPFDDDNGGPNPPAYVHTEIWTWQVGATIDSMENLLTLFHQLPFGLDEVPLISDEELFPILQAKLDAIECALRVDDTPVNGTTYDPVLAGLILGDFEMEVMDACISTSPERPNVTGPGTGIAQTEENPACCKLLVDAEFVGNALQIFVPAK